jgi:hypothetical protein
VLCVLILSRPLPASVPLPAAAQEFFLRVFQNATQDPNVDTLKPVYCMLNGACRRLLSLLPHDAQQQFDRELCRILSSNSAGKDSMLLLWCFGIVLLAERPEDIQDIYGSHLTTSQKSSSQHLEKHWKTSSGQKLFASTKGLHKTITLTCMSVVWAMKGDVGLSDDEAIEGIRIASRVVCLVDRHARESWRKSGALAESTYTKLLSKVERAGVSPKVLFEASCFCAQIAGQTEIPSAVVTKYEQCLIRISDMADPESFRETLSVSLPIFAVSDHYITQGRAKPSSHKSKKAPYECCSPVSSTRALPHLLPTRWPISSL